MTGLWRLMHGRAGLLALAGLVASSLLVTFAWGSVTGESSLTQVLGLAVKGTAPAQPAILTGPGASTSSAVATFTYSDTTSGVTFTCSLDSGDFRSCVSTGVTYSGLGQGSHTFRVRATVRDITSASATRVWSVDLTPPVVSVSFPANSGVFNAGGWTSGCSPAGLCGTASDASGVAGVQVAIYQQTTNRFWNGASFASTAIAYQTATGTTSWRYALAAASLSDGGYTLSVRASDTLGNATPANHPLVTSFKIDTVAPPAPSINQHPDDPTNETSAQFGFTDADAGVRFRCSLDGSSAAACSGPEQPYKDLAAGSYCFQVVAVDAAGNLSPATSFCWTIVDPKSFPITGGTTQLFSPGVTQPLNLIFTNPFNFDIQVTGVSITVKAGTTKNGIANPACNGTQNLVVSRPYSGQVVVRKNSTKSLSDLSAPAAQWPLLTMPNLPTNQDACKATTFALTYQGTAVKP